VYLQNVSGMALKSWASEGFFPGEALADFSTGNHKKFSRGAKSDEISFFLPATKKMTFFARYVIEKCEISKSRGAWQLPICKVCLDQLCLII